MRLEIQNLEDTYDHMRNMNQLRLSDHDYDIEKDQNRVERLKRLCNLSYSQAFLFEPFDYAQLFFRITGDFYSSTLLLYPAEGKIYNGLGMNVLRKIFQRGSLTIILSRAVIMGRDMS